MVSLKYFSGLCSIGSLSCAALFAGCLLSTSAAQAQETAENAAQKPAAAPVPNVPNAPRLHHAPRAVAAAHEALSIEADIDYPELVKRAVLVYRTSTDRKIRDLDFKRSAPGPYIAIVPAEQVEPGTLEYSIELEQVDGTKRSVFASRSHFYTVQVPDILEDARERALLKRLDGRRSVFAASGEYVDFGTSRAETTTEQTLSVRDRYYRVEGSYTYRPLRVVTEFSLRAGIVRGNSPVPIQDQIAPGDTESDRYRVGLNYGAPTVKIRVNDIVHLEGTFLTSITEVGFSVGCGGAIHIGDLYGSKLTLGFESIQVFGSRIYSRMDITAGRRVTVSPIIEVTNMPHASDFGVRLLGEVTADLGQGFSLAARGGYQSRLFTEGGPAAGGTLGYAF